VKLHIPPYVTFKILQFVVAEEPIANSRSNQDQLILALQERLRDFGLTKNESKIYIFLSKNGPKKALEISREEKIPRTETYHLLSNLHIKGIVVPSIQRPTRFLPVTIEKAIESMLDNQQKKIEDLKILKHDMIELWHSFLNIRDRSNSEFLKYESATKKYASSQKFRKDFKRNLKNLRQKSQILDDKKTIKDSY
jgi:sugar-specific transcriptional regulator TrmB